MKDLKDLLYESIDDRFQSNTRDVSVNPFKKMAVAFCERDFSKLKKSAEDFVDELTKHEDVSVIKHRAGYTPKGKYVVAMLITDEGVSMQLKINRRAWFVGQDVRGCKSGWNPTADRVTTRGIAVDTWAHYEIFLNIDESSLLIPEFEEFINHCCVLPLWVPFIK